MRAVAYQRYGSPVVLEFREIEKPSPGDDEVLVRVGAASVNPLDWHLMRGTPRFVRLSSGVARPKNPFLGADIAGTVESVGRNVDEFGPGDKVYADVSGGGFADYVCVHKEKLAAIPANLSVEEAAAIPVAALTALQGIRDKGEVKAGQSVLVNGASGGVGTFAVQIAKAFGAEVTAVCSAGNADLVRSIGADHVIDYARDDYTQNDERYDLVFDAVGNHTASGNMRAVKAGGRCVVVGFTTMRKMIPVMMRSGRAKEGRTSIVTFTAAANRDDLLAMNALCESGKVRPVIDRRYPFDELPQAMRYLEEGHARGKVIVQLQ